jgi:hypothetical protein
MEHEAEVGVTDEHPQARVEGNPDEAREVKAECQDGSIRGRECDNADIALQVIEGRERFARFRGKK